MTFSAQSDHLDKLVGWLRSDLPPVYMSAQGFRGMIVLDRSNGSDHVIAVTMWDDEMSLELSESTADAVIRRISMATGAAPTREIYEVRGTLGIDFAPEREDTEAPPPRRKHFWERSRV
jgi:heme-degrading monooxygenase HmoA